MTSSVILSARRTPVGRFFGGYSRVASPQLGAFAVEAALVSAGVDGADIDELKITSVEVNQGPTMKRLRPRARGRADRIIKRTSHLIVKVSENGEQ